MTQPPQQQNVKVKSPFSTGFCIGCGVIAAILFVSIVIPILAVGTCAGVVKQGIDSTRESPALDTPSPKPKAPRPESLQAVIDNAVDEAEKASKQAYMSDIQLRDVGIGADTFDRQAVFGEIKNDGDRTLKKVEIIIYYLDSADVPIFEEKYWPVSDLSLSDNSPLKANYARKFGYLTRNAPSDWSGEVRVEITNIEFAD